MALPAPRWSLRALFLFTCALLFACGGGSGGGGGSNLVPVSSKSLSSLPSTPSSTAASSSLSSSVTLSGKVTYDFVPHNNTQIGLDYSAISIKPGRGLVVELLDANNQVLATTSTNSEGVYSLVIERNKQVKVRVKAQLLRSQSPAWNFTVTDNTSGNSLYAMDGSLVAANETTATRDLHAASGWTGAGYTQPRVAAPFAILDSIYLGVERVVAAGNTRDFPPLELRWSVKNKAADGDLTLGEIGTSFYGGAAIYILGDENNDIDEYDRHVILHEWGHYLESNLARSDSIGGDHVYGDKLDMRVAMSEGFANAFSAMMLDDPNYRDASGAQQSDGFVSNVSRKNHSVRGWYSEASIQSVFYNFYTSNNGRVARDFTDIFSVINSTTYANNSAMVSVYLFTDVLRNMIPAQIPTFNALLLEQNIEATSAFGDGESNSGGYTGSLPVYKTLPVNNTKINVCSTNRFGAYNKLAVAQFLRLDIASAGTYQITVQEAGDDSGDSDPDIYLYRRGSLLALAESTMIDQEGLSRFLSVGTYVLELVDDRAIDVDNTDDITACFDVRVERLN
ncbi:hypothetical protein [Cellvibrio sp. OA-2007]|uniref:hypothetical protein n=1 Tax=Cellvibrio sp. OA-2007 TaxID=529823 RepID=UPI001269CDDB|nr:hypothetical protein [Cellvibrio sp. OA-2007]